VTQMSTSLVELLETFTKLLEDKTKIQKDLLQAIYRIRLSLDRIDGSIDIAMRRIAKLEERLKCLDGAEHR
jgi:hypothetical protein